MPRYSHKLSGQIGMALDPRHAWALQSAAPARRATSMILDATLFIAALLVVASIAVGRF